MQSSDKRQAYRRYAGSGPIRQVVAMMLGLFGLGTNTWKPSGRGVRTVCIQVGLSEGSNHFGYWTYDIFTENHSPSVINKEGSIPLTRMVLVTASP